MVSRVIIDNRSLPVRAPLLSRARQQAVFGPRARLSIKWKKLAGTRHYELAVAQDGLKIQAARALAGRARE